MNLYEDLSKRIPDFSFLKILEIERVEIRKRKTEKDISELDMTVAFSYFSGTKIIEVEFKDCFNIKLASPGGIIEIGELLFYSEEGGGWVLVDELNSGIRWSFARASIISIRDIPR